MFEEPLDCCGVFTKMPAVQNVAAGLRSNFSIFFCSSYSSCWSPPLRTSYACLQDIYMLTVTEPKFIDLLPLARYKLFQATRMSYAALPVGLSAQTHNAGLERSGLAQSNCLRPHTEVDANTSRITKREGKEAGRPSSCPIEAFNTPQKQVVSAEAGIDQESTADSRRRRERNAVGAFWDWARGLASPPTAVHPERPSAHLQLRHGSKLLSSAARVPLRPAVGAEGRLIERGPGNRGGHLFKLFLYDVFVLLLVFALVGLTLLVGPDDCVSSPTEIQAAVKVGACSGAADGGEWRLWSQLYWIRVLSGCVVPSVGLKVLIAVRTATCQTSPTDAALNCG